MNDAPASAPASTPAAPSAAPASSPSPTPSSAPTTGGSESSSGSSIPDNRPASGGLREAQPSDSNQFDLSIDDDIESFIEETLPDSGPEEGAPASAAAPQPQAPQQPAQQPAAQQPAVPEAPQSTQAQPQGPASIAEMIAAATQHGDFLVDKLAKETFAFSPEDVEALETDAVKALPKVLAKSYLRAQVSTLQMIQQLVPQLVQGRVFHMFQVAKAEEKFHEDFPSLKDPKYRQDIANAGRFLRQQYPQLENEKLIEMAGNMVMAMHGLTKAPAQPAAPAAPIPQTPYMPA